MRAYSEDEIFCNSIKHIQKQWHYEKNNMKKKKEGEKDNMDEVGDGEMT